MRLTVYPAAVARAKPDDLTFRFSGGEPNQGCRYRPKTTYEIGRDPAELMSATAVAHSRSDPDLACGDVRIRL
jgi:hypothetical protein